MGTEMKAKDFEDDILREQVRLAMEQLPAKEAASFLVALSFCYLVRDIIPLANILAWVALVSLTVLGEVLLHHRFSKIRDKLFAGEPWKNAYLILTLISGAIWGLSAIIIFPAGNPRLMSLFILVMGSLAATTTISHSSIRFAPTAWAGPAALFYAIRLTMEGGEFGHTLGLLIILYLLTILGYSIKHNRFITSAIALRFENLELLGEVRRVNDNLRREIAERKIAQETLRESEEKFRLAFQTSPDSINLNRVGDGMYLDINDGFTKITGYTRDDVIGKTSLELNIWQDPKDRERLIAGLMSTGFVDNLESKFRGKDGRTLIGLMSARILRINQENIILNITRDITHRKQEEEERKKLEMQLFHAQKLESVGRLAGGVAHDFNNMLAVIIGSAEMALQSALPTERLRQHLQEILRAGQRSAELTRQLLAFARKQTIIPKILDLNDTISGMLNMLRRLIGEEIDLFWAPGLDLWRVRIDPSQVDQILANLAVNARDAITGVGSITVRTENVVIDESVRVQNPEWVPGDYVLLSVKDTGTGMGKEAIEKIFEPFFTTKEVGKGTGLGLSTVYGIVKQNDGFIYAASEIGKGATFKIYLPRSEAEATRVCSEEVSGVREKGTESILLVEDDEAILGVIRTMLENLGYTVHAVRNPVHAIGFIKELPKDLHLLITDVVMPEMNGRELLEKLRAIRPGLKCLYMSGYTADVIAHRGVLDLGVNFIQKPFVSDDLAARVKQVLDESI